MKSAPHCAKSSSDEDAIGKKTVTFDKKAVQCSQMRTGWTQLIAKVITVYMSLKVVKLMCHYFHYYIIQIHSCNV